MKKLLITLMLTASFSAIYADDNNPYEIIEERIEQNLEYKHSNNRLDYSIDIYGEQANVKIEGRGSALKKIGPEKLAREAVDTLKREANIKDVYVTVEEDNEFGEDKIIFSKRYN